MPSEKRCILPLSRAKWLHCGGGWLQLHFAKCNSHCWTQCSRHNVSYSSWDQWKFESIMQLVFNIFTLNSQHISRFHIANVSIIWESHCWPVDSCHSCSLHLGL